MYHIVKCKPDPRIFVARQINYWEGYLEVLKDVIITSNVGDKPVPDIARGKHGLQVSAHLYKLYMAPIQKMAFYVAPPEQGVECMEDTTFQTQSNMTRRRGGQGLAFV